MGHGSIAKNKLVALDLREPQGPVLLSEVRFDIFADIRKEYNII